MGLDHHFAPGTIPESYVLNEPFESNKLTRDPEMYRYMVGQLEQQPELGLGGPSLRWLYEALNETRLLAREASPDVPCMILLGTDEDIVETSRIHDRAARWPGAVLELEDGARHEVLMDDAETRTRALSRLVDFYERSEAVSGSVARSETAGPDPRSQAS